MVVDPENSDVLYVASDIGVFRSNTYGATWYWANDGYGELDLPRVIVTGLEIDPSTHQLYASTMGRGLYYTQTTGLVELQVTHVRTKYIVHGLPWGITQLRLTGSGTTYTMTRQEVVRRILAGTDVYTVGPDGRRAMVRAIPPDGYNHPLWYLSTAPDDSLPNNLLHLPSF
jgi:hypothetical protein